MNRGRHYQKSRRKWPAVLLVFVILFSGAAYGGWQYRVEIKDYLDSLNAEDYPGPGFGEVQVVITEGEIGSDVASSLVEAGVVKSFDAIYKLILAQNPTFYPGTYLLKKEMTASDALGVVTDPNQISTNRVTLPEGLRARQIFDLISEKTGIERKLFTEAVADLGALGIPGEAPNIEGYLFPATYNFEPNATAAEIVEILTQRMIEELNSIGVPKERWHEVLTLASVVQLETQSEEDMQKAARVFLNRLDKNMPLQSDATVNYGTSGETVTTTDAQREDDNPYNTYRYPGLPVGPIGSPGAVAIKAVFEPIAGPWLYFVTINLETGETIFTNTYADHLVQVKKFQAWLRANPEWND